LKKLLKYIFIVGLLALPITLLILPADYFDHGVSLCPSKQFLNLECLGCGITRGIQHAIHFDFEIAWMYNKLTFVVLPIAFFIWLQYLVLNLFNYDIKSNIQRRLSTYIKWPSSKKQS
jgi:hypothetical protein